LLFTIFNAKRKPLRDFNIATSLLNTYTPNCILKWRRLNLNGSSTPSHLAHAHRSMACSPK
jgi:hypothetical protein